ncbi:ubiquinone anaerobic biosynthesis accessory factor UbiT [Psychromonas ossibalaenae]|uniref:ubiquinone anaerobic biosynthesis accessory factor UbiT n=1 Tax=Psychromonas ossibalaenae TaxID=444922 RepID=UPI00037B9178|nr:SCP2 sterol-binding domain-containing protein [Psychromonas ossibalaenae]
MFKSVLANIHHNLVINAPKVLALPTALLPFFVQKKLLSELLDNVFAEAIEDGDLEFLEEKWLKVEITDLRLTWYLSFADNKLIIEEKCAQEDVVFSGAVNEFILIAGRKEDPDTLFFQRRLSIQGDTELGLEIKNLLDNIDFDNLPPLAQKAMHHFSNFIQQGLSEPVQKEALA